GSNTPVLAPTGLEGGYLLWNDKSGDTLNYVTYDASGGLDPIAGHAAGVIGDIVQGIAALVVPQQIAALQPGGSQNGSIAA
ncbi:hypothetical protein, partial [Pseudoflavonifractor phocaeensis]|uniref:hypothetical protein n=1 Tax=Pseudoflavonifractor phocaeensis TaxID=1870988 RepID=UPI001959527C